MTATKAKSTISNTGGGKTVSGHGQITSLAAKIIDLALPRINMQRPERVKADKKLGEPLWVLLPCRKVIQMGNAGSYTAANASSRRIWRLSLHRLAIRRRSVAQKSDRSGTADPMANLL